MANPFQEGYKAPQQNSEFFKPQDGANLIRILTPKQEVITYYTQFIEVDGAKEKVIYEDKGDGVKPAGDPNFDQPKLNWVVKVLDKDTNQVKTWEISQKTIQNFLFDIAQGKVKNDWTKFDVQITKKGKGMDTEYTLLSDDTAPLTKDEQKIVDESDLDISFMERDEYPEFNNTNSANIDNNVDLNQVINEKPF